MRRTTRNSRESNYVDSSVAATNSPLLITNSSDESVATAANEVPSPQLIASVADALKGPLATMIQQAIASAQTSTAPVRAETDFPQPHGTSAPVLSPPELMASSN